MTALKDNLAALMALVPEKFRFDVDGLGGKFAQKPAKNTLVTLGLCAYVFYQAEKNDNPRVNTIYDALEYCSSSMSVGYTNIFPQTPLGKLVGSVLMTFGPAMTNAILEGTPEPARPDPTQEKILATLEQILVELRAREGTAQ